MCDTMLGLKRGTVQLIPYQEEWRTLAEETMIVLKTVLGETAIDIQHVGSTAITHIAAKPIIDIAAGVDQPLFKRSCEMARTYGIINFVHPHIQIIPCLIKKSADHVNGFLFRTNRFESR